MSAWTPAYVASTSAALILAAGILTVVPFALLTALAWFAWWPPHWLEPVLLFGLPTVSIPWLARTVPPALRRHWWGGLLLLAATWYLASPHLTPGNGLSVGSPARGFAAAIELVFHGGMTWTDNRIAAFATASVAAIAAVSMATWYAMAGLQWMGERTRVAAPAKPVNTLSDAAWAARAEVLDRFSTPGGIVLGELTDPRRKVRFDPADPKRWGRQGKGPLITLDPAAGNAHSLVFSGSGSFKTAGIAIPNALTFAGSLIVIDPKGEIHAATSAVRAARGRNSWLVTEEDGMDPIRLLTAARPNDGTVFDSIAEFLLPTSGDDKADSSVFFHEKAVRLLSALLAHLYYTDKKDKKGTDLFMAANRILAFTPEALKTRFTEAAEEHSQYEDRDFIHVALAEVANTEPRQLSGVTATAANGLSWAGHASPRGFLTSKPPDEDSKPPDGKALLARVLDDQTDIYFRIPTPVLQANPGIARVLIGSLVRVLRDSAMEAEQLAREDVKDPEAPKANATAPDLRTVKRRPPSGDDKEGGKDGTKPPGKKARSRRLFLIDEARAMRRMDTLAAVRDEGRAYGIHLLQIFQSWQQVLECYGQHGAGAWANSVDAVVIGPVSDARQAQELTRMVGRHTVVTSSTSRQRNAQMFMPFSGTAGSSESTQLRELDLIQPSELRQLPPEAAIILAVGTAPIMASKAIWFTRADMTKMVDQANTPSDPEKPPAKAPVPVALEASDEVDAATAETEAQDSRVSEQVKEQGVMDTPVSYEGVGDSLDMAAGQGWFQPTGDATATGVDDGVAEDPELAADENTVEGHGNGLNATDPEASQKTPCTASDAATEKIPTEHAASRSVEILEMAAAWYREQLRGAQGAAVRTYLEKRGFDAEAQGRRGFGFAPRRYGALSAALQAQGVTVDELEAAGLVGRREKDGSTYDHFRDRLMFPILDKDGRCIAFGGRTMNSKAMAKYLNSPQTRTFDKKRCTVYNLGEASARAAEAGVLYVVEGYMDVASMVEGAGISNVVAPLGTEVTSEQLELMWQKADRLVVVLDGDETGRRAAGNVVDLVLPLMRGGRELAFASLPEGEDPDSMIRAGELGHLGMLLDEARPLVEVLWRRATESVGGPIDSPERRAEVDKNLKDALAQIPDPVMRDRFLDQLTAMDIGAFGFSAFGGQAQDKDVVERTETEAGDDVDTNAAIEQLPDGPDQDVDEIAAMPVVSPDPMPSAPAKLGVNKGVGEGPPPGDAEDLPADDCRETGDDSDTAKAFDIDANENTVEEDSAGEESTEPETDPASSSSAMDAVAAGIVNNAVYSAIMQRSHPVQSHPFVDAVLNRPDVKIPPGTVAKVILPSALGDGVEHAESWSLVFVPEDGHSPIQRIVIATDGKIIARCGPYRSGA